MRNFGAVVAGVILIILSAILNAEGVPENVDVTGSNAAKLEFELVDGGDGGEGKGRMVTLKFRPFDPGGLMAKRVQTYLFDRRELEVSVTSSDYLVGGDSPSVIAFYYPDQHDVGFVVQYFCHRDGGGPECAKSYTLNSVNEFIMASE